MFDSRPVRIIRLLGEDTIEEGMYKLALEKLNLEKKMTGDEGNIFIIRNKLQNHESPRFYLIMLFLCIRREWE